MVFTSTDISLKSLDTPKSGNLQPSVKVQMKAYHIKCGSGMHTFAAINCLSTLGMHAHLLLSLMVAMLSPCLCLCVGGVLLLKDFVALSWAKHFNRATLWCTSTKLCFCILIQAVHRTHENFRSFNCVPNIALSDYRSLMLDDEACVQLLERFLKYR